MENPKLVGFIVVVCAAALFSFGIIIPDTGQTVAGAAGDISGCQSMCTGNSGDSDDCSEWCSSLSCSRGEVSGDCTGGCQDTGGDDENKVKFSRYPRTDGNRRCGEMCRELEKTCGRGGRGSRL